MAVEFTYLQSKHVFLSIAVVKICLIVREMQGNVYTRVIKNREQDTGLDELHATSGEDYEGN